MNAIIEIVKKNIKNLIRSKIASLIVILGPLIVIFLAGLAFDNANAYSVKIGTYIPDKQEITTNFIEQLRTQFKVNEYPKENECKDAIKNSDVNTCIVFDANFTMGVPTKNQVTFYVDYSRINLVWTILQVMTKEVEQQSSMASQSFTKILLDTLDYTTQRLGDQKQAIVKLTTQNEMMSQNTQQLMTELNNINLNMNSELNLDSLGSAKTQVKQWAENAISLGERGLNKASSFVGTANSLVSGIAGTQAQQIQASLQKNLDEINILKNDFAKTKELSTVSMADFDAQLQSISQGLTDTKDKLQDVDTKRQFSVRVLEAINQLLDESILSISHIQKAINDIETKIASIEIKDATAITQPIVTSIKPITQEKTYLHYLFPILIVLIIMFTALLITPTLIMLDKHSLASFRTYLTPVKDSSYIIANFITAFIILLIQVIIMLAITSIFFSAEILTNTPKAFIILLFINSIFILMGMIIGYIFNSEETATLGAVSLGAIFLFISDVIIPLESMPETFAYIASFNPYVLGSTLLRKVLLFDAPLSSLFTDIFILIGYIAALALIATGTYALTRRNNLERLSKTLQPFFLRFKKK